MLSIFILLTSAILTIHIIYVGTVFNNIDKKNRELEGRINRILSTNHRLSTLLDKIDKRQK